MKVTVAEKGDLECVMSLDKHLEPLQQREKIKRHQVLVVKDHGECLGVLRYGLFWDEIPFMNLLYVRDGFRNQGVGKALVLAWEEMMLKQGYQEVMTSTLSNEISQYFYRKHGYSEIGSIILENSIPELIFRKKLTNINQ